MGSTYRARPEVDSVLALAILEPTSAFFLPDGGLMELVEVAVDIVESVLLDGNRLDTICLDLSNHLDGILHRGLDGRQ
jgi:hypothetical protein